MIPKVATNLLHFSAARVAAAVQTGTQTITPTFRSVLQHQTQQAAATSSTSTASVGWNATGNAAGATNSGGATTAKFDAGSRFYNAYQNSGFDPSFASSQQDDEEKRRTKRSRPSRVKHIPPHQLTRRNNVTALGPSRLLQARLLHTRTQAPKERLAQGTASTSTGADPSNDTSQAVILSPKSRRRTYSTSSAPVSPINSETGDSVEVAGGSASSSSVLEEGLTAIDLLEEDPEEFVDINLTPEDLRSSSDMSTDPSSPQSVLPPIPAKFRGKHPAMFQMIAMVKTATSPNRSSANKRNAAQEKKELQRLINTMKSDGVRDPMAWSLALFATIRIRMPGESLRPAIMLYNDLLSGNILPPRETRRQKWNVKGKAREDVQAEVPESHGEVIIPSDKVVALLIRALAIRDAEVLSELQTLEAIDMQYAVRSSSISPETRGAVKSAVGKLEELKKENNFAPAMALTNATLQQRYPRSLGVVTYNLLLQSALNHTRPFTEDQEKKVTAEVGGIPSAITIFAHLEKSGCRPSARTFGLLIQIYAAANDLEGAKEVWHEFRSACSRGSIEWILTEESELTANVNANGSKFLAPWYKRAGAVSPDTPLSSSAIRSLISVWSGMIRAYFICQDPAGGLSMLEKMMDAPYASPLPTQLSIQPSSEESSQLQSQERPLITPVDVPPPASETYYGVVRSFVEAGDTASALAWFKRLLEQDPIERKLKWDPVVSPPRPDRALWDVVTQSLFERGQVTELNELMDYANLLINEHFEKVMKQRVAELREKKTAEGVALKEEELIKLARRVTKEEVDALDKRDGHHWALAWRANVAAMETPSKSVPQEMKHASLDWLRTRIVDTAFFQPNYSTYAIVELPNGQDSRSRNSGVHTVDAGEEDLAGLTNSHTWSHSRRFTDSVGQGLRDRAWHAVGLYISQGRIDEGITLAGVLFHKERDEILENEKRGVEQERTPKPHQAVNKKDQDDAEWTAGLKSGEKTLHALADLRSLVAGLEERIWTFGSEAKQYPSLDGLLALMRLTQTAGLMPAMRPAWYVVNAFLHHRTDPDVGQLLADRNDWVNLAKTFAATAMSVFYEDNRPPPNPELAWQLVTFLQILKDHGRSFEDIGRNNVFRIFKILEHHLGEVELGNLLTSLGVGFVDAEQYFPLHVIRSGVAGVKSSEIEEKKLLVDVQASVDETREQFKQGQGLPWNSPSTSPVMPRTTNPLTITPAQTVYIHEGTHQAATSPHQGGSIVSPQVGYERLIAGYRMGDVPSPENIARLIVSLGHQRSKDKIVKCYEIGNEVLASLESNKSWQASGWSALEDAMVTALAHCGDMKAASLHRARLVGQGLAPSASAYGALIANIKDTTDNASVAIELFEESRRLNVEPNSYLYNTIISRLAKARKADYAMLLFQNMKNAGLQPTEVTYGAVIAGCARIGDSVTAEVLFEEMTSLPGYKPRIPPFNTMMQLYTHVKPNRDRALHYFTLMERMGVAPTPYTYKLMLDLYGKNEPVDVKKMDEIIATMKSRNIEVTGNHYSSLIIAYGCTMHDLEGSLNIFRQLRNTPQTQTMWPMNRLAQGRNKLPDVLAYEALLSVLVMHHRIDLMQEYFEQMIQKDKVRPTAYIYNLLIKGWASVGDLAAARDIFERMVDPAAGAAAPNNHAPHMGHEGVQMVNGTIVGSPQDPVYREPSSWEAMVRAELSAGERGRANALLERMKARFYPVAVTAKIENILWEPTPISHADLEEATR